MKDVQREPVPPAEYRCPITGEVAVQRMLVMPDITNSVVSGSSRGSCGHVHTFETVRGQPDWTVR